MIILHTSSLTNEQAEVKLSTDNIFIILKKIRGQLIKLPACLSF